MHALLTFVGVMGLTAWLAFWAGWATHPSRTDKQTFFGLLMAIGVPIALLASLLVYFTNA